MPLPFAAVAFDMDGTFLRDDKSFDRPRFARILEALLAQGCHVIVASGDPAQFLLPHFGDRSEALTVIAENGAQVIDQGHELMTTTLERTLAAQVVAFLHDELQIEPTLAGVKQGYFPPHPSAALLAHMTRYYPQHTILEQLLPLPNDDFFQLSFLIVDQDVANVKAQLDARFAGQLTVTPSGNGSMDLTIPGINKGWALSKVLARWQLSGDDLIAFGDGGNDESMLKLARYSYAMPNGRPEIKRLARFSVPVDNNHDGVLVVLDQYLQEYQ